MAFWRHSHCGPLNFLTGLSEAAQPALRSEEFDLVVEYKQMYPGCKGRLCIVYRAEHIPGLRPAISCYTS